MSTNPGPSRVGRQCTHIHDGDFIRHGIVVKAGTCKAGDGTEAEEMAAQEPGYLHYRASEALTNWGSYLG